MESKKGLLIANSNLIIALVVGVAVLMLSDLQTAFTLPFIIFIELIFIMTMGGRSKRNNRSRLALWNHICKRVGVTDYSLHQVVGTNWLPWAKDQEFDYFFSTAKEKRMTTTEDE